MSELGWTGCLGFVQRLGRHGGLGL
jgi:hypothetical protein